jgi:hypothetical protein
MAGCGERCTLVISGIAESRWTRRWLLYYATGQVDLSVAVLTHWKYKLLTHYLLKTMLYPTLLYSVYSKSSCFFLCVLFVFSPLSCGQQMSRETNSMCGVWTRASVSVSSPHTGLCHLGKQHMAMRLCCPGAAAALGSVSSSDYNVPDSAPEQRVKIQHGTHLKLLVLRFVKSTSNHMWFIKHLAIEKGS